MGNCSSYYYFIFNDGSKTNTTNYNFPYHEKIIPDPKNIAKVILQVRNQRVFNNSEFEGCMTGIKIIDKQGETVLNVGTMDTLHSAWFNYHHIELKDGERLLGVKSSNRFNTEGLHHFDLQFVIGRVE